METPVQGVITRSRSRRAMSPAFSPLVGLKTPQDAVQVTRPRRQAEVFGTPLSALRSALLDVTNNDSPRAADLCGSPDMKMTPSSKMTPPMPCLKSETAAAAGHTPMPANQALTSALETPTSTTERAQPGVECKVSPSSGSAELSEIKGEDILWKEVNRIMASQPENQETPVLGKKKVNSDDVSGESATSAGDEQGQQALDSTFAFHASASPAPVATLVKPGAKEAETACQQILTVDDLLNPTPANTPLNTLKGPLQPPMESGHVVHGSDAASLGALGRPPAAAAAADHSHGPAPTPVSSPASSPAPADSAAAAVGPQNRPGGYSGTKPPVPRSSKGTPKRTTPSRKAKIGTLRIATPIGKTPPPRPARRDEVDKSYDPANLLRAIAFVEAEDLLFPSTSTPERPPLALSFGDSPAVLPKSPAFGFEWTEGGHDQEVEVPVPKASGEVVPTSPAWSLDVHVSTPGANKLQQEKSHSIGGEGQGEQMWVNGEGDEEDGEEEGEEWDCYDAEDEDDLCEAVSGLMVSGRSMALRGLPLPLGKHIRFHDDDNGDE